ncbi:hypothetical protein GYH30_007124 [Glycine max]|nr:hypothetical protein GYH30_007124 [Glycine max]
MLFFTIQFFLLLPYTFSSSFLCNEQSRILQNTLRSHSLQSLLLGPLKKLLRHWAYDHLREFEKTLSSVKAVLLDAEQKQEQNHELQEWLRQLKTVFSDAEDVLDELECQTLRKQVVKAYGTIKDKVSHFFPSYNPLVFRSKMAQQIKDVSMRLDKVAADRQKFGLQPIDVDQRVVHWREMTHSRVSDSDVIGREHDKEKIIELLMQQNPNDDDTSF